MFFHGWDGIIRLLIVGILAYFALIFMIRVSGKRALSKMNAFDLVVTVAYGSILANILLSEEVPLVDGVFAFFLLISLQFLVSWTAVRWKVVHHLIYAEPALLFYEGKFLYDHMKTERITESEIRAAVRAQNIVDMEHVLAVVLENDGSFSVMERGDAERPETALEDVIRPDDKTQPAPR